MLWGFLLPFLGLGAWIGANCAPIAIAVLAWRFAERLGFGWLIHLLVLPVILAAEWLLADLLFFAAGDTGDGPPGLGLALIPPLGITAITLIAYYAALAVKLVRLVVRQRHGQQSAGNGG